MSEKSKSKKLVLSTEDAANFIRASQEKTLTRYRDHLIEEGMLFSDAAVALDENSEQLLLLIHFATAGVAAVLIDIDDSSRKIKNTPAAFRSALGRAIEMFEQVILCHVRKLIWASEFPVEKKLRVTRAYADHFVSLLRQLVAENLVATLVKAGIAHAQASDVVASHEFHRVFLFASIYDHIDRFFDIVSEKKQQASNIENEASQRYVCAAILHVYEQVLSA